MHNGVVVGTHKKHFGKGLQINPCHAELIKIPHPLPGFNQSDYLIQVVDFVCVEVLRPNQANGVMSSAVSLPNHTFTGQA